MDFRKLDATVAKEIMGEKLFDSTVPAKDESGRFVDRGILPQTVSHYSTEIEAAYEITKKCCNTWSMFYHDAYSQWQVKCDGQRRTSEDCRFEGWANELPLAICIAALKAKGIDVSEWEKK